jgi:hypothetical protein
VAVLRELHVSVPSFSVLGPTREEARPEAVPVKSVDIKSQQWFNA